MSQLLILVVVTLAAAEAVYTGSVSVKELEAFHVDPSHVHVIPPVV